MFLRNVKQSRRLEYRVWREELEKTDTGREGKTRGEELVS